MKKKQQKKKKKQQPPSSTAPAAAAASTSTSNPPPGPPQPPASLGTRSQSKAAELEDLRDECFIVQSRQISYLLNLAIIYSLRIMYPVHFWNRNCDSSDFHIYLQIGSHYLRKDLVSVMMQDLYLKGQSKGEEVFKWSSFYTFLY